MLLSDVDLWDALSTGDLEVSPMSKDRMQPASIEMHLGDEFLEFDAARHPVIDPYRIPEGLSAPVLMSSGKPYQLAPGEFVLGSTIERVKLSSSLAARLEGKSTMGRIGLMVHSTAGWVDPGFSGQITLELSNISESAILLWPGMRIGQLCVMRTHSPAEHPYGSPEAGSHYQGQRGPTKPKSMSRQTL